MKKHAYPVIAALTTLCACAQSPQPAIPPWTARITVTDEAGMPVAGAEVEVSYYIPPPPGKTVAGGTIRGLTDTNGFFRASHADTGSADLGFRVTKAGYYTKYARSAVIRTGATRWRQGECQPKSDIDNDAQENRHPKPDVC